LYECVDVHLGEVFAQHRMDEDVAIADLLENEAIACPIKKLMIVPRQKPSIGNNALSK
jgi:hypothetical protein